MKPLIILLALLVGACSYRPYRIDVRQGNFVTTEMVAQLKPGQTREQVRFILGSPLLEDPFHAQRWDYVYRFVRGGGETTEHKLTVYFDGGKMTRFESGIPQRSAEEVAADAAARSRILEIESRGK